MRPAALAVLLCVLTACARKDSAPTTPPDQTYRIRGQVTALPNPPKQALRLHHEAIPDFIGADGKVQGMDEMEMEFPYLAPSARLDSIALNDAVEATMEIRWKSQPRFVLTSIRKLPTGTHLSITLSNEKDK
jgi:hypothetical protein